MKGDKVEAGAPNHFPTMNSLQTPTITPPKSHKAMSDGSRPYLCTECNATFTRNDHLTRHLRIHTGEKPFHCSYCPMAFNRDHHLKRHEMAHRGETPFHCNFCEKKFSRNDKLSKHLRVHTGQAANNNNNKSPTLPPTQLS